MIHVSAGQRDVGVAYQPRQLNAARHSSRVIRRRDDLDGGWVHETVRFAFGGTEYEIDLSKKKADAFRKQIAPYAEHGRKVGRIAARRGVRTAASRQRSSDIRAGALDQGITVSERGRIPASVVEQYETATGP